MAEVNTSAIRFLFLVALSFELVAPPVDTRATQFNGSTTNTRDLRLSGNVSWWAESASLALNDLATRSLGHDQLQQLYDNSVCVTSMLSDDVNVSQRVIDAASMLSQFITT